MTIGHCSTFSGHSGVQKTCNRILSRFFRPHLKTAIIEFIRKCDICQRAKVNLPKRKGELRYLTPTGTNQIVTIDIAGSFPES